MTTAYQQILDLLPQVSPEDLADIQTRISVLQGLGVSQTMGSVEVVDPEDWLLRGIVDLAKDRGLAETMPPFVRIINKRQFHGYRDKAAKVRSLFERHIESASKTEKYAFGYLLAKCLASRLSAYRPVTFGALMESVEQCVDGFDDAFPGYLASNKVGFVLKAARFR